MAVHVITQEELDEFLTEQATPLFHIETQVNGATSLAAFVARARELTAEPLHWTERVLVDVSRLPDLTDEVTEVGA